MYAPVTHHAQPANDHQAMFDILEADIVVFQETKIQKKDLRDDMVLVSGWDCYFSLPRVKKGTLP
jgi:AP endonuclease-2